MFCLDVIDYCSCCCFCVTFGSLNCVVYVGLPVCVGLTLVFVFVLVCCLMGCLLIFDLITDV